MVWAWRMAQCGLTSRVIRMFQQSQAYVQRSVNLRGTLSQRITFHAGVPQGAVTSPVRYSMFIDGLPKRLAAKSAVVGGQRIATLLYADDIALRLFTP